MAIYALCKRNLEFFAHGVFSGLVPITKTHELIPVPVSRQFAEKLAIELPRLGYSNRSEFIREAIVEKLQKAGIKVPLEYWTAPTRMKTGRPVSFSEAEVVADAVAAARAEILRERPELAPKPGVVEPSEAVGRPLRRKAPPSGAVPQLPSRPPPAPKQVPK